MYVVNVVCCAGRGFCDELITRPEESYPSVVCLSVIVKSRQGCGLGSSRTIALREKTILLPSCTYINFNLALCSRIISS